MLGYQEELKKHYHNLESKKTNYKLPKIKKLKKLARLIVCTGYSGSGKSTFGTKLKEHGFKVVNNDAIRLELFNEKLVNADKEVIVLKASLELRDWYLSHGYDVIVTNCTPTNWYRQLYLTTGKVSVSAKILLRFLTSKDVIEKRKGLGAYEFIDALWEEVDFGAEYMKGVKYIEIDSSRDDALERNVESVLRKMKVLE